MTDPWILYRGGIRWGTYSGRRSAMNAVDKSFLPGNCFLRHARTGETWTRARGVWNKLRPGDRPKRKPAAKTAPQPAAAP